MLMTVALSAALFAGHATCNTPALLTIPLRTSEPIHRAKVSGYTVRVVQDPPGWEVQVFAATDAQMRDNLLYPSGNWHGAFPCQVQPETAAMFGEVRRVKVRAAGAAMCIRLLEPKLGPEGFRDGLLEIGWTRGKE